MHADPPRRVPRVLPPRSAGPERRQRVHVDRGVPRSTRGRRHSSTGSGPVLGTGSWGMRRCTGTATPRRWSACSPPWRCSGSPGGRQARSMPAAAGWPARLGTKRNTLSSRSRSQSSGCCLPSGRLRPPARPVCAPGFSCRIQIQDGTGVRALHPVQAVAAMLGDRATGPRRRTGRLRARAVGGRRLQGRPSSRTSWNQAIMLSVTACPFEGKLCS